MAGDRKQRTMAKRPEGKAFLLLHGQGSPHPALFPQSETHLGPTPGLLDTSFSLNIYMVQGVRTCDTQICHFGIRIFELKAGLEFGKSLICLKAEPPSTDDLRFSKCTCVFMLSIFLLPTHPSPSSPLGGGGAHPAFLLGWSHHPLTPLPSS